jgi:hypothetical protein
MFHHLGSKTAPPMSPQLLWQQPINQSINHPKGQKTKINKTKINQKKPNSHPKRRLFHHLGSKTAPPMSPQLL